MPAKIDQDKCNGCGTCVETCAVEAIKLENGKAVVNDQCIDCAACTSACPCEAIQMVEATA